MKSKGMPSHYPLSAVRYPLSAIRYPLLAAVAVVLMACSPKGEALYQRAEQSLGTGDVRAAVIDLKNLVKDEPDNAKARALLAAALVQNGEMSAAEIEIKKARDLGATPETLLMPECRVMTARGEFDAVLAKCSADSVPADIKPEMQVVRGQALLGLERAPEAKVQFEAALATEPDSLDALLGLASAAYAIDGLPAAQAVMDKASEAFKSRARYWMAVGGISLQGGDAAAAEKAFQKALDSTEKKAEESERLSAMGALAEAQMRQGKVEEANATTAQMMKAAPKNPLVKQLRAQVAAAGGNLDEARTLLEETVAAMPDNHQARTLLGIVNMQQGNLGQAEMHFADVVAAQPNNIRVQRLLAETRARHTSPEESLQAMKSALEGGDPSLLAMAGRMSLASGDREQGLAYLTQAAEQTGVPQEANVQLEIASGYLMAGDLDRAVDLLEKMPADAATGFQREYLLMAALLRKGDTDAAVAEAKALLQRSGSDPLVRNLVAGVYVAAGQKDAAREQFNEALKLKPNDLTTLLNLGRLDLAEGNSGLADSHFRQVLEVDPKHMMATLGLAVSAASRGDTKEAEKWLQKASSEHPESVEAQMALAQFHLGTRDFGKARTVIDEALKKSPDNAALLSARGLALLGQNDLPGAIASFQQAMAKAPRSYGYALNLARAHLVNRDLNAALGVLNDVLRAEPKFLPALALAGAATLQGGQLEKATGYIERLRQAVPDSPVTLSLEGDLAMAQKRYKDAVQAYRKAAVKAPSRQLVLSEYRAASLAGEDRPEKVIEDWVAAHPDDLEAIAVLAEVRQRAGDEEASIRLYEQALTTQGENPILLNNLAVLYQAAGDARALPYAERAYKAAPKAAPIQDTYGWVLFKSGKIDEAVALLRSALNGLPDNVEVQYHLGAALAKQGEKAEAVALLKKAVRGPLPAEAKADAQKLLEQLSR